MRKNPKTVHAPQQLMASSAFLHPPVKTGISSRLTCTHTGHK